MRDGWVTEELGELASTVSPSRTEAGQPYVGLEHFDSGVPTIQRWGATEDVSSATTAFRPGDALFSKLRPYLRKVAVATFEGRCTAEALVYRPCVTALSAGYLGLVLQSASALSHAQASSAGSRMPRTSVKLMSSLEVQVPPAVEQQRIVDLLGQVDSVLQLQVQAAEVQRRAQEHLLRRLLNGSGRKLRLSELFEHVIGGAWGSPAGEEAVRVQALGPRSYSGGRIEVDLTTATERSLNEKRAASRALQPGDLILERSGGTDTQPVGRVLRMTQDAPNTVPSDFMRLLRPDPDLTSPGYIFWWMWLLYQEGATVAFQTATTNIRNLNITNYLSQTSIPVPPKPEQEQLVRMAEAFQKAATDATAAHDRLVDLRANLLTALLSGEHEIPNTYDKLLAG